MISSLIKTETEPVILIYDLEVEEAIKESFEILEEKINPTDKDHCDYAIYFVNNKQRDQKLFDCGIYTYLQLSAAYYLLKHKRLNQPKSIRDLVESKYTDIINETI